MTKKRVTLIQTNYQDIRHLIGQGDDILFGGEGGFSSVIKWGTGSEVSHIESVLQTFDDLKGTKRVQLIGSTSLNGQVGVQTSLMSDRIKNYKGNIWWAPLSKEVRQFFDEEAFFKFMLAQKGKPYEDYKKVVASAIDIPITRIDDNYDAGDLSAWFCSELRTEGFEKGIQPYFEQTKINIPELDRFKGILGEEITPKDCAAQKIHEYTLFQLKGKPTKIKEFNSGDWKE